MSELLSLPTQAEWSQLLRQVEASKGFAGDITIRETHIKERGWCIVTRETAEVLGYFLRDKSVVEVFAGKGYVANALRQASGLTRRTYKAYDTCTGYFTDRRYPGVTKRNAFTAPIKKADVIMMAWPPYDTNHAERIAKKMVAGQWLVYNGEGSGGCTGNDAFYDYLDANFVEHTELGEQLDTTHVTFSYIRDCWRVYQKS